LALLGNAYDSKQDYKQDKKLSSKKEAINSDLPKEPSIIDKIISSPMPKQKTLNPETV